MTSPKKNQNRKGGASQIPYHPRPLSVLLCLRHKNVRSTHREHSPLSLPQMPLMDDAPAHSATHPGFWIQDFTPVLEGKNKNTKTCNLYGIHQRQPTKVDADVGQKEAALCVSLGALSREF